MATQRAIIRIVESRRRGFTLIEVTVSMVIVGILLGGLLVAYSRTADRVEQGMVRSRAMGVAQKKMEYMLASMQEPNVADMQGEDEQDPRFSWEVELKRVPIGGGALKKDLSNTVIEIKVSAHLTDDESTESPKIELIRYVANLKPRPGQLIAVPATPPGQEPLLVLELREKLGRDPTPAEIAAEMMKQAGIPANLDQGDDQGNGKTENDGETEK